MAWPTSFLTRRGTRCAVACLGLLFGLGIRCLWALSRRVATQESPPFRRGKCAKNTAGEKCKTFTLPYAVCPYSMNKSVSRCNVLLYITRFIVFSRFFATASQLPLVVCRISALGGGAKDPFSILFVISGASGFEGSKRRVPTNCRDDFIALLLMDPRTKNRTFEVRTRFCILETTFVAV